MTVIPPTQWSTLEDQVNEHRDATGETPIVATDLWDEKLVCALTGGGRTVSFTILPSGHLVDDKVNAL